MMMSSYAIYYIGAIPDVNGDVAEGNEERSGRVEVAPILWTDG
jgi:hypothetical protein